MLVDCCLLSDLLLLLLLLLLWTVSNALSAAEQALLTGDEERLLEALKALGVQNLQAHNKGWYLKQLLADRENKEQVGSRSPAGIRFQVSARSPFHCPPGPRGSTCGFK